MDYCPPDRTKQFIDGYLTLVDLFFFNLDCGSEPFLQMDDSHEADLEIIMEMTMDDLNSFVNKNPPSDSEEFCSGVNFAIEQSLKVLKLAFNAPVPSKQVA